MKQRIIENLRESCPWQDSLLWFDSIDSTNAKARELAKQGAPHGTVLIADHQTGGRGRRGRSFHSPAGVGIYMSVVLRPNCEPQALMHLTCATAVAMCDAMEHSAIFRPGIKWTNDLVFNKRKIAGVLTELSFTNQGLVDFAVIGIGINCCQQEDDFPEDIRHIAGSLESVSGKKIDRAEVAAAMMDALYRMDQQLQSNKAVILDQYRTDCITIGQEISLVRGDEVRYGKALDINSEGALIVQFSEGTTEIVNSGEVSVRGMYGYV